HARHILVATEPFAERLVRRLDKGEKFDVLAKQESMDSSKSNGGDLGWFTPDRMVPEFAGALVALKAGEYTHRPIQTQYGWHIIQLLETRGLTPPPFEQVRVRTARRRARALAPDKRARLSGSRRRAGRAAAAHRAPARPARGPWRASSPPRSRRRRSWSSSIRCPTPWRRAR